MEANKQDMGRVFEGTYSDPNHPEGFRVVSMLDEWEGEVRKGNCLLVDDKGGKEFNLPAKVGKREDGSEFIMIDFAPKGGPKDFEGVWETDGIRYLKDNNKWPMTEKKN